MKWRLTGILFLFTFILIFSPRISEAKDCYDCHQNLKEKYNKKCIHSPVEEKDCLSCHKDHGDKNKLILKLEGNKVCYQCHDSYETEFRKQDRTKGIKLSHFNFPVGRENSKCIDCHDPHASDRAKLIYSKQHKPFAERKCIECHKTPELWQPVKFVAEGSELCFKCHKLNKKSYVHTPVEKGECTKCHDPHTSPNEFELKAEYNEKLCYKCHKKKIEGEVKHSPVAEGDCLSCHVAHSSDNPNQLKEVGVKLCYSCHEKVTGKGIDHAPVADSDCIVCHDPHSSNNKALLVETDFGGKLCYRCHDEKRSKGKYKHVAADEGGDCMGCHEPHSAKNKSLLKKTQVELCYSCHENKAAKKFKHRPVEEGECTKCHDPLSSPYIYMLKEENNKKLCYMCHKSVENTKYVHTPVAEGNCKGCHDPHSSDTKYMLRAGGNKFCYLCHQVEEKEFDKKVVHKPLTEENGCLKCHTHHGSDFYRNLRGEFPEEHQIDYSPEKFAFCFTCHDSSLTTYEFVKGKETNFRRGELNLHFIHVNQQKKRGRKCTVCHSPHATDNYRMLYDYVPFGDKRFRYKYPVGYSKSEKGVNCLPGCHGRKFYGRDLPTYMK